MLVDTIIDNDYVTLLHYPEYGIIHHQWHQPVQGEQFRAVLERGLEIFRECKADKWLSDERLNSALPKEDGIWGLTNWNPRVRAAGWKYWAVIFSDTQAGQANLNYFMREGNGYGITARVFEAPEDALNWLKSVK